MERLEEIFYRVEEERGPNTPEMQEIEQVWGLLLEDIQKNLGAEMAEKVNAAFHTYVTLESYHYFLEGIQLGLELLRL